MQGLTPRTVKSAQVRGLTPPLCIPLLCVWLVSTPVYAQDAATPGPVFEVASIRAANPEQGYINASTPSLNVGGDRMLRFGQITLRDLIMLAYGIGTSQIQGPGFLDGTIAAPADRFDVQARVPPGATSDQVPLMLRALLAERFHLVAHWEHKTREIYALEVGRSGLKMKESPQTPTDGAPTEGRCTRSLVERDTAILAATCTRMTSGDIALQVQTLAPGYFRDGPVVDVSGLKGVYDFRLEWISVIQARAGEPGPTMMDAVEQQLGLKLERRRQDVDVLVIDKVERTPDAN